MNASRVVGLILSESKISAAQAKKLDGELLVRDADEPRKKRASKKRFWTIPRLEEVSEHAREGFGPKEISEMVSFDVKPGAVQAQMYLLFPEGNRRGIQFKD